MTKKEIIEMGETPKIATSLMRPCGPGWKTRVESFSENRSAGWLLFFIALIEGAVFPVPPDPLLVTLSVTNARKSFLFAAICATGSVLGSFIGYGIGYWAFESFARAVFSSLGVLDAMSQVLDILRERGMLALILAGFTPVPYAIFSITSGMNQTLDFSTFAVGSLIGRTLRFGVVGLLFYFFGEKCKMFLEQHFGKLSLVILFIVIFFMALFRWLL